MHEPAAPPAPLVVLLVVAPPAPVVPDVVAPPCPVVEAVVPVVVPLVVAAAVAGLSLSPQAIAAKPAPVPTKISRRVICRVMLMGDVPAQAR